MVRDPHIDRRHAVLARVIQVLYPVLRFFSSRSKSFEFASTLIEPPSRVVIPTRHGDMNAFVVSPSESSPKGCLAGGEKPPIHLLTHGGAFIIRYPQEEISVAKYLASEVGCFVVIPDYLAAPQVRHPVAEQQCYDALVWIRKYAAENGWDPERISVGGPSAGGQLALEVALQAIESGGYVPVAVTSEYGVADLSRSIGKRTSKKRYPVVGPALMNLVYDTYFKDVDLFSGAVSPLMHHRLSELPPTLIITAEFDTLRHESNDLAYKLKDLGVRVTHREFDGVDHGFTHRKPVETARSAIAMIGDHLRDAYQCALD